MKIKAKIKNGVVNVKCMVKHENSTYNQAEKKTGSRDNANFITHISAKVSGEVVFEGSTSQFISKNTMFEFNFKGIGAKGDEVEITWIDRKGNSKTDSKKIK